MLCIQNMNVVYSLIGHLYSAAKIQVIQDKRYLSKMRLTAQIQILKGDKSNKISTIEDWINHYKTTNWVFFLKMSF